MSVCMRACVHLFASDKQFSHKQMHDGCAQPKRLCMAVPPMEESPNLRKKGRAQQLITPTEIDQTKAPGRTVVQP